MISTSLVVPEMRVDGRLQGVGGSLIFVLLLGLVESPGQFGGVQQRPVNIGVQRGPLAHFVDQGISPGDKLASIDQPPRRATIEEPFQLARNGRPQSTHRFKLACNVVMGPNRPESTGMNSLRCSRACRNHRRVRRP